MKTYTEKDLQPLPGLELYPRCFVYNHPQWPKLPRININEVDVNVALRRYWEERATETQPNDLWTLAYNIKPYGTFWQWVGIQNWQLTHLGYPIRQHFTDIRPDEGQDLFQKVASGMNFLDREYQPERSRMVINFEQFRSFPKAAHALLVARQELNTISKKELFSDGVSREYPGSNRIGQQMWQFFDENEVGKRNAVWMANQIHGLDLARNFINIAGLEIFNSGLVRVPLNTSAPDFLSQPDALVFLQACRKMMGDSYVNSDSSIYNIPENQQCMGMCIDDIQGEKVGYLGIGTAVMMGPNNAGGAEFCGVALPQSDNPPRGWEKIFEMYPSSTRELAAHSARVNHPIRELVVA